MKLPNPQFSEVFNLRLTKKNKQQLDDLVKKSKYGNNCSAVLRSLIELACRK
jgi:Arc/MetJ-type ribon-helix-helix transcriptional regulator